MNCAIKLAQSGWWHSPFFSRISGWNECSRWLCHVVSLALIRDSFLCLRNSKTFVQGNIIPNNDVVIVRSRQAARICVLVCAMSWAYFFCDETFIVIFPIVLYIIAEDDNEHTRCSAVLQPYFSLLLHVRCQHRKNCRDQYFCPFSTWRVVTSKHHSNKLTT